MSSGHRCDTCGDFKAYAEEEKPSLFPTRPRKPEEWKALTLTGEPTWHFCSTACLDAFFVTRGSAAWTAAPEEIA